MPAAILGPVAGAVVGGLMSDGGGSQQTATKDPWGPTQKPLTDMVNDGVRLNQYYQQNPFNQIQQTAYQNLFGDIDAFRGQNAGLMEFANRLMGTNYSRSGGNSAGQMGGMASTFGNRMGTYGTPGVNRTMQGLLGSAGGPFSVPQGRSYGLLDFQALNPYTSGAIKPEEKPTQDQVDAERRKKEEEERLRLAREDELRGAGA